MIQRYLLVDDDPINNLISKHIIKQIAPDIDVRNFELPVAALDFIASEYKDTNNECATILFLDINMPVLNGWDFLEEFAKMDKYIHDQFIVYILSSSTDPYDREKAMSNVLIKDFLSKPVSVPAIKEIVTSNLC